MDGERGVLYKIQEYVGNVWRDIEDQDYHSSTVANIIAELFTWEQPSMQFRVVWARNGLRKKGL